MAPVLDPRIEAAREHLRYVCRVLGSDPEAAEARAREAFRAEVEAAQRTIFPPSFDLVEAFQEEERLARSAHPDPREAWETLLAWAAVRRQVATAFGYRHA